MFKDKLRKQYFAIIATLFSGLIFGFSAQAQTETHILEIVPAKPKAYDPLTLRLTPGFLVKGPQGVKMKANRITVAVVTNYGLLPTTHPPLPGFQINADLGRLPAGNYEVEVVVDTSTSLGVKRFVVAEASPSEAAPLKAFTDLWWNPAEPGWGVNITAKNGALFAAWLVYDDAGRAAWLTIQGAQWIEERCYQGQIWRTAKPVLGGVVDLNKIDYSEVGSGKFCLNNDNHSMQFSYKVDGVSNQKTLYRQAF